MPCQLDIFFDNFVKSWLVLSRLPMQLQRRLGPSCGSLVSICPNPTDFDISLTFLVFYLFKMIFGSFDVIWCHLMSFVSIWNVICLFLATGKWDREAHISPDALRDLQASVSALGTAHVVSGESGESGHQILGQWRLCQRIMRWLRCESFSVCELDMSSTSHWSFLKLEAQCWLGGGGASRSGCWLMAIKWRRDFSRCLEQNL